MFFSGLQRKETSPKGAASGAVAQLGERRDGIAKVWGSIPHGSTILPIKLPDKPNSLKLAAAPLPHPVPLLLRIAAEMGRR